MVTGKKQKLDEHENQATSIRNVYLLAILLKTWLIKLFPVFPTQHLYVCCSLGVAVSKSSASPKSTVLFREDCLHFFIYRYDRAKLTLKDIHSTQYIACMNPTAGSFTINPRLQVRWALIFSLACVYYLKRLQSSVYKWSHAWNLLRHKYGSWILVIAHKTCSVVAKILLPSSLSTNHLKVLVYPYSSADITSQSKARFGHMCGCTTVSLNVKSLWKYRSQ